MRSCHSGWVSHITANRKHVKWCVEMCTYHTRFVDADRGKRISWEKLSRSLPSSMYTQWGHMLCACGCRLVGLLFLSTWSSLATTDYVKPRTQILWSLLFIFPNLLSNAIQADFVLRKIYTKDIQNQLICYCVFRLLIANLRSTWNVPKPRCVPINVNVHVLLGDSGNEEWHGSLKSLLFSCRT